MKTIKMSIIGLGGRGTWWLGELLKMDVLKKALSVAEY